MTAPRRYSDAELDELKARNPCEEIARRYVTLRRHAQKWIGPCPIHSPDPAARDSTGFECDAEGWVCAVCADGGDVIKLVQRVEQLDFLAAVERLGGVRPLDAATEQRLAAERARRRARQARSAADFRERERGKVFDIWQRGLPIAGTAVETYLRLRLGLSDPSSSAVRDGSAQEALGSPLPPGARLRCIDGMPYYATGKADAEPIGRAPAMLAPLIRGGKFSGLHITYIDLDAPKGKYRPGDEVGTVLPAKKVRGSVAGAHLELGGARAPRRLVIGEGIEKVLAVWLALSSSLADAPRTMLDDASASASIDETAFWTSIDLGNLGGRAAESVRHPTLKDAAGRARRVPGPLPDLTAPGIEIPECVDEIVILGDAGSDRFTTECAIARAAARWERPGRRILVAWAWPGEDFDDVLRCSPDGAQRNPGEACAGYQRILAALAAAMPIAPDFAAPAVHAPPAEQTRPRRQARPQPPSPSAAEEAAELSPAEVGAVEAAAAPSLPPGEKARAATLALDCEEKLDDVIAECAGLDENDVDNGKRLRRYFGRDLIAIAQSGQPIGAWLHWSGMHWDIDGGVAGANILAQKIGDLIAMEADYMTSTPLERERIAAAEAAAAEVAELDAEAAQAKGRRKKKDPALTARRKALTDVVKRGVSAANALVARKMARLEFGNASKNMARIKNMLEAAGPHVRHAPEEFNADPLLVTTRTHTLRFERVLDPECPDPQVQRYVARVRADREHRRSDLITAMVPVAYDRAAQGPKWESFLARCMPHREKLRTVQMFAGLGLTGLPVQRLMFHHGGGANGKSVFLEVITRLLGDSFAVGLPVESITGMAAGAGASASPDIARLFGKRMLRVHELPQGVLLKAEVIKKLTGGERMTARELYKGFFEFQPRAKPHMSGNDFPSFDGSDGGMRRRLIVMHWDVTIPENEQRDFEEFVGDLLTEGPAILNWLIAGALDYLQNNMVIAEEVRADTASYFNEMDPVGQFFAACLDQSPQSQGHDEKARDVYNAYVAWSLVNAKPPMKETRFGRIAKKKIAHDDTKRVHLYLNVTLHDVPERPQEEGRGSDRGQSRATDPPPIAEDLRF